MCSKCDRGWRNCALSVPDDWETCKNLGFSKVLQAFHKDLQGFPLNQLENSSELSRLLLDRTKELEIMAAPFYLLSILALVSLLSWHFKGAPGNKNRLIRILLNPLLSVIPLLLIQIQSVFGSNTVKQINSLVSSDLEISKFIGLTTYIYSNIYSTTIISCFYFIFVCLIVILGNKKARNLI